MKVIVNNRIVCSYIQCILKIFNIKSFYLEFISLYPFYNEYIWNSFDQTRKKKRSIVELNKVIWKDDESLNDF